MRWQLFILVTKIPSKNKLEEAKFILVHGSRGSVHGQRAPFLWAWGEAGNHSRRGKGELLSSWQPAAGERAREKMNPSRAWPQSLLPPARYYGLSSPLSFQWKSELHGPGLDQVRSMRSELSWSMHHLKASTLNFVTPSTKPQRWPLVLLALKISFFQEDHS